MNEGRPYQFAVVPNRGNFRVAPDSAEFWGGSGGAASGDSGTGPIVTESTLPRGIRFATLDAFRSGAMNQDGEAALPVGSVDPGSWVKKATFYPDGTARGVDADDVDIVFYYRGARPLHVKLRGLTGTATTEFLRADGSTP